MKEQNELIGAEKFAEKLLLQLDDLEQWIINRYQVEMFRGIIADILAEFQITSDKAINDMVKELNK